MIFRIEDIEKKTTYVVNAETFRKKLANFLILYEIRKTDEEKESIFQRFELAIRTKAIALYESNGFKFMVMPERR